MTRTVHAIHATVCPDVVTMPVERRWRSVADDVSPLAGTTLLHTDLNEDNLIITPDGRPYVVDWAFVARGAAWVELGLLIPWLLKAGHSPRDADEFVSQFGSWSAAGEENIDLFTYVFAETWRVASETTPSPATWVALHSALAKQWADHRLGEAHTPPTRT